MASRALTALLAILAAVSPAAAAAQADAASLQRTRESLERQLEAAKSAGVVSARGAASKPALRDGAGEGLSAGLAPSSGTCLSLADLARTESALGDNPTAALDGLRAAVPDESGETRAIAELQLAKAYLALGFAEEARAIAAARQGAEAAGVAALALLAEGRSLEAASTAAQLGTCGELNRLVIEIAAALGGARRGLSPESQRAFSRLPPQLRRPIAEAMAVAAIADDEPHSRLGDSPSEERSGKEPSEASRLLDAAADADAKSAAATLSEIGAWPGPHRAAALQALSARLDDGAPTGIDRAFDSDAEEAIASASGPAPVARLSLSLANRRAQRKDFAGAAKALSAAFSHEGTRVAALDQYRRIVSPLWKSKDPSDRLSALAIIAAEPQLATESLPAADIEAALRRAAQLGASQSASRLLSAASLSPEASGLLKAEAAYRAGDFAAARSFLEPSTDDRRAVELLRRLAVRSGDADAERRLLAKLGPDAATDFFWRTGDFRSAADSPLASAVDRKSAERLALAHLSLKRAPPAAVMTAASDARLAGLFAKPPKEGAPDAAAIGDFTGAVAQTIGYLQGALNDE